MDKDKGKYVRDILERFKEEKRKETIEKFMKLLESIDQSLKTISQILEKYFSKKETQHPDNKKS